MSQTPQGQASEKLWTTDFVLNLLTAHFLFTSYTSLFTILPPYVLDRGGREWQIGMVIGSFGVVALVARPFAGRWTAVFGPRIVAGVGAAIFAFAGALYIGAVSVWLLLPVRMLQGIGMALAPVATATIAANLAPAGRRAEGMAHVGNSIAACYLYAPVLAFWLRTEFDFPAAFLFGASSALLASVLAFRMSSKRTRGPVGDASDQRVPLVSRGALFPAGVFVTYTVTTAPIATFLPLLADDRALGNPGLFFTVYSVTTILAMSLGGPLSDRAGRGAVIVPGLLATVAAMFLLSVASRQSVFLAAGFLTGVGFGLIQPGMQSLAVDRVAPRERGPALATLQQAWDVGGSGGAFVLGPIGGLLSVGATFAIVGVGAMAGVVGFLVGNAISPTALPRRRGGPAG